MKGTTTIAVQPCQHGHVTDEAIWYYRPRQLSLNVRQALEAVVSILRIHRVQVLKHQSQISIMKIATLSDTAVFMCHVAEQLRPQMCIAVWMLQSECCSLNVAVWMLQSECCSLNAAVWLLQSECCCLDVTMVLSLTSFLLRVRDRSLVKPFSKSSRVPFALMKSPNEYWLAT